MPADRRIIINVSEPATRNDQGEAVPGAVTPIGTWASRKDIGDERKLERQGTRQETSRDWRIRWDRRIALSPTLLLKVEDGAETFTVINMVEVTEQRGGPNLRRRFLDLQGIHG